MLRKSECTSVIVECGFLSNWEEATELADEFYQDKIAAAINKAVIEYLSNI
jgi:N-acetylmuramoyl-L-alanine amidase